MAENAPAEDKCCQTSEGEQTETTEIEVQTNAYISRDAEMQTIEEESDEVDCSVQVEILNTAQVESLQEQLETLNKQHKVLIEQLQDELEEANRRIEEFESQKQLEEAQALRMSLPEGSTVELPQMANTHTQTLKTELSDFAAQTV